MSLIRATVSEVLSCEGAAQKLVLKTSKTGKAGEQMRAINYLSLGAPLAVGEEVLVNVTALELGLGTGGYAFVVPNASDSKQAGQAPDKRGTYLLSGTGQKVRPSLVRSLPGACPACLESPPDAPKGHIVKLRYTPLQTAVLAVEEPASPYHELLREARSVEGMPVVCCALHSQVPLVAAALKHTCAEARIAYVMTDEAALLLSFSDLVPRAQEAGLLDTTITCGQALGGQYEAVTLHSALLAARFVAHASVAIVALGPGTVGTGTAFGTTGLAQGEALNAVAAVGGAPIAALRVSGADERKRHQGVSHHSITVLRDICLAAVAVPLPAGERSKIAPLLHGEPAAGTGVAAQSACPHHTIVEVEVPQDIDMRGLKVTTMGRTAAEDPAFFQYSFAAGIYAARLLL